MKFKAGDKVKILWEKTPYCSIDYTDKGEIVEVFEKRRMLRGNYEVRGFREDNPLYTLTFKEDELILLEEEKQTMKKSDLKQGALVQMRNGNVYILIGKKFVNLKDGGYMPLEKYNEDLYNEDLLICHSIIRPIYGVVINSKYDVMKVFNSSFEHEGYLTYIRGYSLKWTWERKEEEPSKELTVGEIEKLLGYKVKIVKENEENK